MTETGWSAEAVVARTRTLVTLPDIYLRIKAVVEAPESSLDDLTHAVSTDPALAARLLKIANSAFYSFPARIETLSRAVTMLGTQQIHDLVLATSVAETFAGVDPGVVSMRDFWIGSIRCAVLARLLAQRCNVLDSERLFVEGLLHDIGHLLLYQVAAEACVQARQRAAREGLPLYQVEAQLIGCDYAQVGAELMRHWQLPAALIEATACQNNPAIAREHILETSIINIAISMLNMDINTKKPVQDLAVVAPVAWQQTGLLPADMPGVRVLAETRLDETVADLFPAFSVAGG